MARVRIAQSGAPLAAALGAVLAGAGEGAAATDAFVRVSRTGVPVLAGGSGSASVRCSGAGR
jgi:biotin transporter BioY